MLINPEPSPSIMSGLTKNDSIKLEILKQLRKRSKMSPSMLASEISSKYETVTKALAFFERLGAVRREEERHGKGVYVYYELTTLGEALAKNA